MREEPGMRAPGMHGPETRGPGMCEPETREPQMCEPDMRGPETCEPEIYEPEMHGPRIWGYDWRMAPADKPETVLDDTDPAAWAGLMAAAQDGDRDAYGRLLTSILPTLRAFVRMRLHDRTDVEDTVQDILLAVHEARASFDPTRPFKPWLLAIAGYRAIDRMRIRGRTSARETSIEPHHETFSPIAPKQDDMDIDSHALHAALAQLPAGQRIAIEELKLREGSLQEVSARTGISIAALKVATHRGMKRLRALLVGGDTA